MDEGKRVLGVTVEDAEGAHDLGPAKAALVFLFDDTGGGFSASGTFSPSDVLRAIRVLGVIAGLGFGGGDGDERVAFEIVAMKRFLDGMRDEGSREELFAESVLNEMGACDGR